MARRAAIGAVLLGTCASCAPIPVPAVAAAQRIEIEETGCYGPCPVFRVSIDRSGTVDYAGARHVAQTGTRSVRADPGLFGAVQRVLEPFKPRRPGRYQNGFGPPASGAATVPCGDYATDGGTYIVTWTAADGVRRVEQDRGCQSPEAKRLMAGVRDALSMLPSAAWSAQRDRE